MRTSLALMTISCMNRAILNPKLQIPLSRYIIMVFGELIDLKVKIARVQEYNNVQISLQQVYVNVLNVYTRFSNADDLRYIYIIIA